MASPSPPTSIALAAVAAKRKLDGEHRQQTNDNNNASSHSSTSDSTSSGSSGGDVLQPPSKMSKRTAEQRASAASNNAAGMMGMRDDVSHGSSDPSSPIMADSSSFSSMSLRSPSISAFRSATAIAASAASASSSSSTSGPAVLCAMLRVLQRDCHAQFHLTHFLDVEELAAMHQCCRTWRLWIEHPPTSVVDSLQRQRLIQAENVQQFALCLWARLYFTTITIDIDDEERVTTPLTGRINRRNRALFARICFSLSLFPRLKQLHVTVCAAQMQPEPMQIAFTAMAASLTYFSFDAWGPDAAQAANSILQHIPILRRLDTLEIGPLAPAVSQQRLLDLSSLARVPSLQAFIYGLEACAGTHRFTPAQVAALANCPNLTSIEHACWGPLIPGEESLLPEVEEEEEEDNVIEIEPLDGEIEGEVFFRPETATPELQIQLGIAALVAAQVARANALARAATVAANDVNAKALANSSYNNGNGISSSSPPSFALASLLSSSPPAAVSSSSSSSSSSFSIPCVPTLQRLSLGGTVMSAAVWSHVSQLIGLTSLAPLCWRADMSCPIEGGQGVNGGWEALGRFSSLHTLDIRPHPTEFASCPRPLVTSDFFAQLLRCRSLTFLALGPELALTAAQIAAMGPALPQLETLHLRGVSMHPGSTAALQSLSPSLRSLSLEYCSGPKDAPAIQLRTELPPLSNLARLVLFDRCRITAAEAEPLNIALLARMPKLTRAQLVQNLLAPIHKKVRRG